MGKKLDLNYFTGQDIEKNDGSVLKALKGNYINPRCKGYLEAWTSQYYQNLKDKVFSLEK